jgi:ligand-binding sensor domain-containing protein/anti-sigma regulatory factor (Ser/Thr protein kinase)
VLKNIKNRFKVQLLFTILLSTIHCVNGQYYNYDSKPFDISSGLAHNEINDLIKDDYGYVWVATDNGLARYDGYNFIQFNQSTHPKIFKGNRILEIKKNKSLLYLLTESDGLIELNPRTISFKKVYSSNPRAIAFSNDTTVILFDTGTLLFKVKNKVRYRKKLNVFAKSSMVIYKGKVVLSLNNTVLMVINPKQQFDEERIKIPDFDQPGNISLSKRYGIVMCNGDVVRVLKNKTLVDHPDFIDKKGISFFSEEPTGKVVSIERSRLPKVFFGDKSMTLVFDKLQNVQFKSILRVSKSCFFIATNQGIIKLTQEPSLTRLVNDYSLLAEEQIIVRRNIQEYHNKRYYLGFPHILVEAENTAKYLMKKTISTYDGLMFNGQLFCTTEGNGLISVNLGSGEITKHLCHTMGERDSYESISPYADSLIVLTNANKLIIYNPISKTGKPYYFQRDLVIHFALRPKESDVIYLGTNKGLRRIRIKNNGSIEQIGKTSAEQFDVRDILVRDRENTIWLATSNGVVVLDKKSLRIKQHFYREHEVSNLKVVKLLEDKNNNIWASTYAGLTVYNVKNGSIKFINKSHGLHNTEFNYKSGQALKNGELAFGGLNAFEVINPNLIKEFEYVNSFQISGIEIIQNENIKQFSTFQKGDEIYFNTGKEALKIYLSNQDYQYGKGYTFEYSLDSKTWFKVDDKNCILLSNLANGDYSLSIRMYNPFGELIDKKKFKVSARVPFYAKTSFIVIILVLLFIFSALTILYYIRSIQISTETKSKIAMDLHDESGTILTRLLILVNRDKFGDREKAIMHYGLKEALYSFRTYLDSISKTKVNWLDLSDELKDFISKTCNEVTMKYNLHIEADKDYTIKSELARDIKLLVYEIVTNCIKHSNADAISMNCTIKNNQLNLIISDSGICDLAELEVFKGNGIRNMKKRVSRNNGRIMYYISNGSTGLTIEVFLPIT